MRTVPRVSTWQSVSGRGRFSFGVPTVAQIEHAARAEERALEALIREEEANGGANEEDFVFATSVGVDEAFAHPVWWFETDECDADLACVCGRSSLLDAVTHVDVAHRAVALDRHTTAMRALYDHFWSGQGLLDGSASEIGDACASCLTVGTNHVWDVFDAASEMAEELGETLAAFSFSLELGEPRFDS